jgi:hypothetical protein
MAADRPPRKKQTKPASDAPPAKPKKKYRRPNPPPAVRLEPLGSGRPQVYRDEFVELVYRLALLSQDDEDIASFFGIDPKTLYGWDEVHPEFCQSRARGKLIADGEVVVKLHQRAMGYEHEDVHISSYEGNVTMTPIIKHYPPDTQAATWWLKNRQPKKWRDKVEVENSGTLTVTTVNYADT